MFDKFIYYLADVCLLLLGGNDYAIYNPVSHDIPMLQEQHDLRADLDLTLFGATASVAYAFDDRWAVQGSFQGMVCATDRIGGQLSAGWFTPIKSNNVFEVYAGASFGHGKLKSADMDSYEGHFQSCFIQADYGWCNLANSHIDIALGLKGGLLHAKGTDDEWYNDIATQEPQRSSTPWTQSAPFLESALSFRFGWERLKFNLNASMTISPSSHRLTNIEPRTSLGLNYYFNTKKPKSE